MTHPKPLGSSKHRLGDGEGVRISVTITQPQMNALEQLRMLKGLGKSEVVTVALDLAFTLSVDEILEHVNRARSGGIEKASVD